MSEKVKLTKEQMTKYNVRSQQDLDRLQHVWNDNLPEPIEFEPYDEVSDMMKEYLKSKSQTNQTTNEDPTFRDGVSDMMKEYIKTKKSN